MSFMNERDNNNADSVSTVMLFISSFNIHVFLNNFCNTVIVSVHYMFNLTTLPIAKTWQ
jgi:hypothetical protein